MTARSKLPQKKWTGLTLPRKPVRNCWKTGSTATRARQKRCAASRVIAGVDLVEVETDRIGKLVRHPVDRDRDADFGEACDQLAIEIGNAARAQRERANLAGARPAEKAMVEEVELDLEQLAADRDGRGGEAAGADIERHLPAVVDPGRQGKADLADDLGPQLQRQRRVTPFGVIERRARALRRLS